MDEKKLIKNAKDTIKLGTISTIGVYAFGRVGAEHPVTAPTANAVVGGLQLLNVGQMAKNAMLIPEMMKDTQKKQKKKRKK